MNIYTDASGYGVGGIFGARWYADRLSPCEILMSIAWRELLAVVIACRIWGNLLTGKRLMLYCDNESVVRIVNSGSSKCLHVMHLVQSLFSVAVDYNFDVRLRHVPGVKNVAADLLSRGELEKFKTIYAGTSAPAHLPCLHVTFNCSV